MPLQRIENIGGQSLLEIIIALAVGTILIGAAVVAVTSALKSNVDIRTTQVANSLSQEYIDILQTMAESNWQSIYGVAGKGSNSQFYLSPSSTTYVINTGNTTTIAEGRIFTRYLSVENAGRDSCGIGNISTNPTSSCSAGPGSSGVTDDPSTQKITVTVSWGTNYTVTKVQYLTRYKNKSLIQSDWSGGSGQSGPITSPNNRFYQSDNVDYTFLPGAIKIQGF